MGTTGTGSASIDTRPTRTGILVLGMHRSGTSAVTRVLSLLGAKLPEELHPPGRGNETGHWEPDRLIKLHDRLLREAGSRWDDWRAFDPAVLDPARLAFFRGELSRLLDEEYGEAPLFVLKDPRICRFVPLYLETFARAGITPRVIQVVRNPLDVAASLGERNDMSRGFVELMWLRHVLEAESATRDKARVFVSYDTFLDDWRAIIEAWARALDIDWPRSPDEAAQEIHTFLTRDHRHHAHALSDLEVDSGTSELVRKAYPVLLSLVAGPASDEALAKLTAIRTEFDALTSVLGDAVFRELARREGRLMDAHGQAEARAGEARSEIESLSSVIGERDREIGSLRDRTASLGGEVVARDTRIAEMVRELASRDERIASLNQEIATANTLLERVYNSRSWRATAPFRLLGRFLTRGKRERFSSAATHRSR